MNKIKTNMKSFFFPLVATYLAVILTTLLMLMSVNFIFGATITIKDADLGTGTYSWTKDNVYLLDGFVYLETGGTLNIQAGTVVKAKETPSTADNASALIITRGAQIFAMGTSSEPIIFTSELDDLTDPSDLDHNDRGLWGGLVLLGSGQLAFTGDTANIEGIPTSEPRAKYGGTNDADNSGTLQYVSIRHTGAALSPGNEIQGLTLGGVGSATTIEHVESFASSDDGVEIFGGKANLKWFVSAYNTDDALDYDFGWRGNVQFFFVIQDPLEADNGGEHDGAKPDAETPASNPIIYNATFIGSGSSGATAKNATGILLRDAAAVTYANSIWTGFAHEALEVEDLDSTKGVDSYERLMNGEIKFLNNIWYDFGSGNQMDVSASGILRLTGDTLPNDPTGTFLINHMTTNNNTIEDPMLRNIDRTQSGTLDPRLKSASPAYTSLATSPGGFFTTTTYKGAFDGATNWALEWSALGQTGYFDTDTFGVGIDEASGNINELALYPNPSSGNVRLSFNLSNNDDITVRVVNMLGEEVKLVAQNKTINSGVFNTSFDMSNEPKGLYIVQISGSKGMSAYKQLMLVD